MERTGPAEEAPLRAGAAVTCSTMEFQALQRGQRPIPRGLEYPHCWQMNSVRVFDKGSSRQDDYPNEDVPPQGVNGTRGRYGIKRCGKTRIPIAVVPE